MATSEERRAWMEDLLEEERTTPLYTYPPTPEPGAHTRKSTLKGGVIPPRKSRRKPRAPKQNGHVRVMSDGSPEGTRLSVNGFVIQGVQGIEFSADMSGVTCVVRLVVKDVDLTAFPPGITIINEAPGHTFHAVPSPMDGPVPPASTGILRDMYAEASGPLPWDDPKSDPIGDIEKAKAAYARHTGVRIEDVRESFAGMATSAERATESIRKSAAELLREARERRERDEVAHRLGIRKS